MNDITCCAAAVAHHELREAKRPDAKIAQLADGTIAIVGTHSGGGVDFVRQTATGIAIPFSISTSASDSNPDIAAIATGSDQLGFVVAYQRAMGGANHDIEIYYRADGLIHEFTVDGLSANDQNASVAGLADGGFAVAWERIDGAGNSAIWYAVYNHDGSVRKPQAQFFLGSNHQVNVTALQSGGFMIGFESNLFSGGGQTDIIVGRFNSAGVANEAIAWGCWLPAAS